MKFTMLKFVLIVFAILFAHASANKLGLYTSLVWSSCSTAQQKPTLMFERLSLLPTVIF